MPDDTDPGPTKTDFSLRALRVFVALEETGSIAGAAARLSSSPSGVSQQITTLEQAFGVKLFDRKARPIVATPAGSIFSVHAHRVLHSLSEARAEMAALSLAALPELGLAVIDDLDATVTPVLAGALQQQFRDCYLRTFTGRSDAMTGKLEARQADIAVTSVLPHDLSAFQVHPILREPFLLVVAKDGFDPAGDVRQQLSVRPMVQYSESMPMGRAVSQHLKRVRLEVPRRFAFEATRSVFAMVARTGGWTLSTPLAVLDAEALLADLELHALPFAGVSRQIHLAARAGELGRLPEELADQCRTLIHETLVPRFTALTPSPGVAIEILES